MRKLFILALLLSKLAAQPLFTGITLEQFGIAPNRNKPLFTQNRLTPTQQLRTNDFQIFQQEDAAATDVIRMGAFYIGRSTSGILVSLPAFQNSTTESITTPTNNVQLTIGASEVTTWSQTSNLLSTQAMTVNYFAEGSAPPATDTDTLTMVDYNIVGNAFHDVRYNDLSPVITFTGSTIVTVAVDDGISFRTSPSSSLRRGTKYKVTLANGQVFLLYFERGTRTMLLSLNQALTQITSSEPFTGFLRIAAIQTTAPDNASPAFASIIPSSSWATAIVAQTRPPTPLSMYMLWPVEWTTLVGNQILAQLRAGFSIPDCQLLAEILPVLARTNLSAALSLYNQITDFGPYNNSFLTLFNIYMASNLSASIAAYQALPFTPLPKPPNPIPNATATENAFDASRTIIPISADIEFSTTEDVYSWTYTCEGDPQNPLIIFPGYKTLLLSVNPPPFTPPIAGFGYVDAVKGPLFGQNTIANEIRFVDLPVPTWYNQIDNAPFDLIKFIPNFLTFTSSQRSQLNLQLRRVINDTIVPDTTTTTDQINDIGRQIYTLALTAKLGGFLLAQNGLSANLIGSNTRGLIDQVKTTLTAWLTAAQSLPVQTMTDFFAGDTTPSGLNNPLIRGGICGWQGMSSSSTDVTNVDEGNAIYNNHHLQYGYWLAAAAIVVEWDQLVGTRSPWISQVAAGSTITNRELVDMLWRDCRNPDKEDADLPFNRCSNPWEGHSTQNGVLYTPLATGRFQERFGEDFNSWLAVNMYARAIQVATPQTNFDILESFSRINIQMTASAGELIFQDTDWIYSGPFIVNVTAGSIFDTQVEATTTITSGTACPIRAP